MSTRSINTSDIGYGQSWGDLTEVEQNILDEKLDDKLSSNDLDIDYNRDTSEIFYDAELDGEEVRDLALDYFNESSEEVYNEYNNGSFDAEIQEQMLYDVNEKIDVLASDKTLNLKTDEAAQELYDICEDYKSDAPEMISVLSIEISAEKINKSEVLKSAVAWTKNTEQTKDGGVKITSNSSVKTPQEMKQSVVDARAAKQASSTTKQAPKTPSKEPELEM